MWAARRNRRIWELPAVRVLYDLFLLRRAREAKARSALAHSRLTLLVRHRAVWLWYGHANVVLLRAVGEARGIDRSTVARCRRIVRARRRGRCTCGACAAREESLVILVLAHAAISARTWRTGAVRVVNGRGARASDTRLVTVWRDLSACEVRGAPMPHYAVGVEVTVKVVLAAAAATPAQQTDDKDSDQTNNPACNATDDCAGIAAVVGAGTHGRRNEDGRLDGCGGYLAIGSGGAV
jgi:hypothetical protein